MIEKHNRVKKIAVIDEKQIIEMLSIRTGLDKDLIHTLIHFYERIILHQAMLGNFVRINNLFIIYHKDNQVYIDFTDKAKKYIKKK